MVNGRERLDMYKTNKKQKVWTLNKKACRSFLWWVDWQNSKNRIRAELAATFGLILWTTSFGGEIAGKGKKATAANCDLAAGESQDINSKCERPTQLLYICIYIYIRWYAIISYILYKYIKLYIYIIIYITLQRAIIYLYVVHSKCVYTVTFQ